MGFIPITTPKSGVVIQAMVAEPLPVLPSHPKSRRKEAVGFLCAVKGSAALLSSPVAQHEAELLCREPDCAMNDGGVSGSLGLEHVAQWEAGFLSSFTPIWQGHLIM